MRERSWTKRLGILLAVGMIASACSTSSASPSSAPVTINVLDVAGNLQLTKQMMENFKTAHP